MNPATAYQMLKMVPLEEGDWVVQVAWASALVLGLGYAAAHVFIFLLFFVHVPAPPTPSPSPPFHHFEQECKQLGGWSLRRGHMQGVG